MKLRRMRDEYWLAASARVTVVMEKVTPATVIMEPAMAVSSPREPSAPAPKSRGHASARAPRLSTSSSVNTTARATLMATRTVGTNQRLVRRASMISRSLFTTSSQRLGPLSSLTA